MGNESRHNPTAWDYRGPNAVIDARGRTLQEGDEIILAINGPIYFRVAGVGPVLDPQAPPGLFNIHLGCMLTFVSKRGQINREFVRVRTAEEAGPLQFKLLDARPAGQAASPDFEINSTEEP